MDIKVTGNKMVITTDLHSGIPSATGKSLVVASTNGFIPVEGTEYKVSINVIKPRKA